ncbi:hypothetical protein LNK82_02330 [Saccharothrix sp. NEAU-S10]|nr:hypothetical protein [Saccharothrix luteola]
MTGGRVVEAGERDAVFDDPRHEYTRALLAAVPRIRPDWERARLRNAAKRHDPADAVARDRTDDGITA